MCVYLTVVLQIMAIIVTNRNDQRGAPHIPTVTMGQCQKGVSYKILILNRRPAIDKIGVREVREARECT